MKTKIAQKTHPSPSTNQARDPAKETTWVQSVVLDFNEQILTSLQVKEVDHKKWEPVLQWLREVLIVWALANTKDVATCGVLSADDTKQLRAAVFRISGILQGTSTCNAKTSGGLEHFIKMKNASPFVHQLVTAFHNILNAGLLRAGVDQACIPDILLWGDDHLFVHARVGTGSGFQVGVPEETAIRARTAAGCLDALCSGCIGVRWEAGELSFVFPADVRRSVPFRNADL